MTDFSTNCGDVADTPSIGDELVALSKTRPTDHGDRVNTLDAKTQRAAELLGALEHC